MLGQPTYVRRPVARVPIIRRKMRTKMKMRGLGQYAPPPAPALPSCTSAVAQSIPQAALIAGGGLATLIGVIGAIFSDQYREDFAIAAGVGLVSSFIGGIWAGSTVAACASDMAPQIAASPIMATPPVAPAQPYSV